MLFVPDEDQSESQKQFVAACKRIDECVETWLKEDREKSKRIQAKKNNRKKTSDIPPRTSDH